MDFFMALILLPLAALPNLLLSLLNRLLSGSPVFFVQDRVGRNGDFFRMYKFRTMHIRKQDDSSVTVRGDSRITPLGGFLRRWKLDELPQLWNVLRGDMGFVGSRPEVPGYMDLLEGDDRRLLSIRPGMSGPATIKYRNEEEILAVQDDPVRHNDEVLFPDKVRINLEYYEKCSLWLDLRIMFITIGLLKAKATDFWMD